MARLPADQVVATTEAALARAETLLAASPRLDPLTKPEAALA